VNIAPFKLERYFAKYEFNTKYLLSSSDCESLSIRDLLAYEPGAAERFQDHWLGYTETQGSPELRREICTLYKTITPDQVLVFTGAEEGIFVFMNAALAAGDHLIVHTPVYQSLYEIARSVSCEVTAWMTHDTDGWELDVDGLEQQIRPNTRAIVVNCPHNPTGYLMNADRQQRIVDIARRHGLLLFSDEVYRGLEHDPADRLPTACDLYENAVSLGVLSKTYGLPGLRIGWVATRSATLYQRILAMKDYTSLCNSAPSEFLACVALRHHEAIARRNVDIVHANLRVLHDFFARYSDLFDWQPPNGGSIAFPRLKIDQSAEAFCADVVTQQGVLLVPSAVFDYGDRHFRIGYGRKNLPEAVEQFEAYLVSNE
jgi:aspartate/methionine/tyrosine aminotransferase